MTIKEIRELLSSSAVTDTRLQELKKDSRKGVQRLIISYEKKQEKLAHKK